MQVVESVIGRNCHIGKDAVVVGSYLLEGVRIHTGAQVYFSICPPKPLTDYHNWLIYSTLSFLVPEHPSKQEGLSLIVRIMR